VGTVLAIFEKSPCVAEGEEISEISAGA